MPSLKGIPGSPILFSTNCLFQPRGEMPTLDRTAHRKGNDLPRTNRRTRLAALGAAATTLSSALLTGVSSTSPAFAAAGPEVSPAGKVLVVTANLQEAFNASDLRNMSELGVFVPRLLKMVPHRPDVLLLQDVRKKAVLRTAELLTKQTGDRYRVGQSLRTEPWQKLPKKVWYSTETAILVNTATMEIKGDGGFVRIKNPWGEPKAGYTEYKGQAFTRAVERDGGADVGLMSVHLPKEPVENSTTAKRFGPWVERLAQFMKKRYPVATRIIGGDFNQTRCLGKDPCREAPFWKTLTSAVHGYTDALWTIQEPKHWSKRLPLGVDLIFTTDDVENAGGDVKNPPVFYSDHRFFWAYLEAGRRATTLTAEPRLDGDALLVEGDLKPSLNDVAVTSRLLQDQGGTWTEIASATSRTDNGHYAASFTPSTGSCVFRSRFGGDDDHEPSEIETPPFDCADASLL